MEVVALFNLYANGVSVLVKAALFRTRAHPVGVPVERLNPPSLRLELPRFLPDRDALLNRPFSSPSFAALTVLGRRRP